MRSSLEPRAGRRPVLRGVGLVLAGLVAMVALWVPEAMFGVDVPGVTLLGPESDMTQRVRNGGGMPRSASSPEELAEAVGRSLVGGAEGEAGRVEVRSVRWRWFGVRAIRMDVHGIPDDSASGLRLVVRVARDDDVDGWVLRRVTGAPICSRGGGRIPLLDPDGRCL